MSEPAFLPPESAPRRRWIIVAAAAAITAGLLAMALYLGDWARKTRSARSHEERLERLLARKPAPERGPIAQALRGEGMTAQAEARSAEERKALAERWGGLRRATVLEEAAHGPLTEVFSSPDAIYILYFDGGDHLRAFTFVSP